jgi:hypothetical protein
LDLGSLEGHYSAELAMRGAKVLSIEGRRTNLDRALELFPLPNIEFVHDDVRNLSREKYGGFDIVLCLGILYHLDIPDCFQLLKSVAAVCDGFAIIDTNVGLTGNEVVSYGGQEYRGYYFTEYAREPTPEEQEGQTWLSINNLRSFWPTKPSLINAIIDAGFTSVYECQYPAWNDMHSDRVALVALKGKRERLLATPFDESILNERMVEECTPSFQLTRPPTMRSRIGRLLRVLKLS